MAFGGIMGAARQTGNPNVARPRMRMANPAMNQSIMGVAGMNMQSPQPTTPAPTQTMAAGQTTTAPTTGVQPRNLGVPMNVEALRNVLRNTYGINI